MPFASSNLFFFFCRGSLAFTSNNWCHSPKATLLLLFLCVLGQPGWCSMFRRYLSHHKIICLKNHDSHSLAFPKIKSFEDRSTWPLTGTVSDIIELNRYRKDSNQSWQKILQGKRFLTDVILWRIWSTTS
jgi:hypothetical protein